eukprot:CAMPEP_0206269518 /NCGR_PEP_ID=MMETSP0047_2-20121206/32333_1 /ASSEMBLY_ACC=CAM_ASM_000192 /TAXON_ID=195065 /ORGANISM="Chroomonas mesostigmatica_cf, Strain CCMP1168" /LENGTH=65 /DNA_ID=CAMNT_0053698009 /DNA_START=672 /DNA_END=865 /DNA_ORIENTATION=-
MNFSRASRTDLQALHDVKAPSGFFHQRGTRTAISLDLTSASFLATSLERSSSIFFSAASLFFSSR